jgi:hypothetical protein
VLPFGEVVVHRVGCNRQHSQLREIFQRPSRFALKISFFAI